MIERELGNILFRRRKMKLKNVLKEQKSFIEIYLDLRLFWTVGKM